MKLISWNVNGIRACVQKGFLEFFQQADADIFCIQESKMQARAAAVRFRRVSSILELCGEKRVFGNGDFYKRRADFSCIRHGN